MSSFFSSLSQYKSVQERRFEGQVGCARVKPGGMTSRRASQLAKTFVGNT